MDCKAASKLFRALGDETRLIIVRLLNDKGEICACQFLGYVQCGQATLSHHLAVLSRVKLLMRRREGKRILYRANNGIIDELMTFLNGEANK